MKKIQEVLHDSKMVLWVLVVNMATPWATAILIQLQPGTAEASRAREPHMCSIQGWADSGCDEQTLQGLEKEELEGLPVLVLALVLALRVWALRQHWPVPPVPSLSLVSFSGLSSALPALASVALCPGALSFSGSRP